MAKAVINDENKQMESMNISSLLDLFQSPSSSFSKPSKDEENFMEELWDEDQYRAFESYSFLSEIKK